MTLAMLALTATMAAQDARISGGDFGKVPGYRKTMSSPEVYGTLVATTRANTEEARFKIDEKVRLATRDEEFVSTTERIKKHRFSSAPEALNVLASHGWVLRSTLVVNGRNGQERHYIMAKPVRELMPITPWNQQSVQKPSRQK